MPKVVSLKKCSICGKPIGYKTRRKYCDDCAIKIVVDNIKSLTRRKGKYFEKWYKNTIYALKKIKVK